MDRACKNKLGQDISILLITSFLFAAVYIGLEDAIMAYGKDLSNELLLRFLPVIGIQFGMSCLGPLIVIIKNREKPQDYYFVKKNACKSIGFSLVFAIPTLLFLWYFKEVHSFLPFQGMFLTKEILHAVLPFNFLGYFLIALVWGVGEGLYYTVLSQKINTWVVPKKIWNLGAFVCALFAVLIHGLIGMDFRTMMEALATFILMYGILFVKDRVGNAWGIIAVFFIVWNAF